MRLLIGIDDTDNLESRGTGFIARRLGESIEEKGLGEIEGITRHQLFVHPQIPYTSHNSSLCLDIVTSNTNKIITFCCDFLIHNAAQGSDVGLCVISWDEVNEHIKEWGNKTKKEILNKSDAIKLAVKSNIFLEGLTGTKDGIIGALAATGLRAGGNDGRFVWIKGKELRDLKGIYTTEELLKDIHVDIIETIDGQTVSSQTKINVDGWLRPVIKNNKVVLIVTEENNNGKYQYKIAPKEYIKNISN